MTAAAPLLLSAKDAAELTGLVTAERFRRAVARGELPPPHCPKARPQMWSRAAIEAALTPAAKDDNTDPRLVALEERWGMR